jgi:uncharacterized delta-60 repeat protein
MKHTTLFTAFAELLLATHCWAQPEALDPTFGTGGIVFSTITPNWDAVSDVLLLPDGDIVLTGYSNYVTSPPSGDICAIRLNSDGSLDTDFGFGGVTTVDVAAAIDIASKAILLADGRILIGGYSVVAGEQQMVLVMLLQDGSLDSSFGDSGIATNNVVAGAESIARLLERPDGRFWAVGYSGDLATATSTILRYNADGSLDNTFDGDGVLVTNAGGTYEGLNDMDMDSNGNLLAIGATNTGSAYNAFATRILEAGGVDITYGINGFAKVTTVSSRIREMILLEDNSIVAAGEGYNGSSDDDFIIMRFTPEGQLDASFGTNNGFSFGTVGTEEDNGYALAKTLNNKYLVIGESEVSPSSYDVGLAVFTESGAVDLAFSTNGVHSTPAGIGSDRGRALAVYPDGQYLVAGYGLVGTGFDFLVMRYLGGYFTGTPQTSGPAGLLGVFPNPAQDGFRLQHLPLGASSVRVINTTGQRVVDYTQDQVRAAAQSGAAFPFPSQLPQGLYTIEVTTSEGILAARMAH